MGSSTGSPPPKLGRAWHLNQRIMLAELSARAAVDALPQKGEAWLDARLSGVVQSDPEVTRDLFAKRLVGARVGHSGMTKCKMVVDVDGNANSWGYLWKVYRTRCKLDVYSAGL